MIEMGGSSSHYVLGNAFDLILRNPAGREFFDKGDVPLQNFLKRTFETVWIGSVSSCG